MHGSFFFVLMLDRRPTGKYRSTVGPWPMGPSCRRMRLPSLRCCTFACARASGWRSRVRKAAARTSLRTRGDVRVMPSTARPDSPSHHLRPVPCRQKFLQTKIVTLFWPLFDFAPPWIFGIVTYAETPNFVNLTPKSLQGTGLRPVPWRHFSPPWIFGIVTYAETRTFVNLTPKSLQGTGLKRLISRIP